RNGICFSLWALISNDMDDNSFFSMDRLLEFGLGMSIAQQMVKSMNETMSNMHVPGAMNPMGQVKHSLFYAVVEGNQVGPLSESELSRLITEKKVAKETHVWMPGMSNWQLAENVPEVLKLVALAPPPFNGEK
ncbi:DUF4339 domain-containing protein, partial [Crocinitomicaceae bacterium]|nr:DUF4339 domain-containing protein [Crocinitomicaceae bacterium]